MVYSKILAVYYNINVVKRHNGYIRGATSMKQIPTPLVSAFRTLLIKYEIPQRSHFHYLKWLRYSLDFCHNYGQKESDPQSLPDFINKLKKKSRLPFSKIYKWATSHTFRHSFARHLLQANLRSEPSRNTAMSERPWFILMPILHYQLSMQKAI